MRFVTRLRKRPWWLWTLPLRSERIERPEALLEAWIDHQVIRFPYSPELNLIEILWRRIKYTWLPFAAYECLNALSEALEDYGKGGRESLFLSIGEQIWTLSEPISGAIRMRQGLFRPFYPIFSATGHTYPCKTCRRLTSKAKQTRFHSPSTFLWPRKENWRKPSTSLIIPITGSTVHLRKP